MNKPPDRRPEQQVQQHREPGSALDQRPDGGVPDQPDTQRAQRPGRRRLRRAGRGPSRRRSAPGPGPARRPRPGHDAAGGRDQADHPRHPDGRLPCRLFQAGTNQKIPAGWSINWQTRLIHLGGNNPQQVAPCSWQMTAAAVLIIAAYTFAPDGCGWMPSGHSRLVRWLMVWFQFARTTFGYVRAAAASTLLVSCSYGSGTNVFTRTTLRLLPTIAMSWWTCWAVTPPLVPSPTITPGRSPPLAASCCTSDRPALMKRLTTASMWMPGNACCNGRDTANMTESPTAVMSLPGTSAAVRSAVLGLALTRLAVLAFADRPSASTLAPCETCRCRPLGAADGLISEQPAAQATTIAPRVRPLIAVSRSEERPAGK